MQLSNYHSQGALEHTSEPTAAHCGFCATVTATEATAEHVLLAVARAETVKAGVV